MKKRILSMLLVIVMVLSLVPVSALAEGETLKIEPEIYNVIVGDPAVPLSAKKDGAPVAAESLVWATDPAESDIATVSSDGKLTGLKQGEIKVVAVDSTTNDFGTKTYKVYQPPVDLKLVKAGTAEAPAATMKVDDSVQLGYTCSNISQILPDYIITGWSIRRADNVNLESNEGILEVDSAGNLSAKKVGTATVRLAMNGRSVTQTIEVLPADPGEITIDKSADTMLKGQKVTLSVSMAGRNDLNGDTYQWVVDTEKSTGSVKIKPSASNNTCVVTGSEPGSVTINVTRTMYSKKYEGSVTLTVNPLPDLTITPSGAITMYPYRELTLTADVEGVQWESDKPDIANVEIDTGKVTTHKVGGPVTITAKKAGYNDATCQITVEKNAFRITDAEGNAVERILAGQTVNLQVRDKSDTAQPGFTFDVVDSSTGLSVTASGELTGHDKTAAPVEVKATKGGATVTQNISVDLRTMTVKDENGKEVTGEISLYQGDAIRLAAWAGNNPLTATWGKPTNKKVTVADGLVTGVNPTDEGKPAEFVVSVKDYGSITVKVKVLPKQSFQTLKLMYLEGQANQEERTNELAVHETRQLVALDTNGNVIKGVKWDITGGTGKADLVGENKDQLTGTADGNVELTAECVGFNSQTVTIHVTTEKLNSVTIPASLELNESETKDLLADAVFDPVYASNKTVTFRPKGAKDADVVEIDGSIVKAKRYGIATVIGTYEGVTGYKDVEVTVTVKAANHIELVELDPIIPTELVCGDTLELKAVLKNAAGETLETPVQWQLSNDKVIKNLVDLTGNKLTAHPQSTYDFNVYLEAFVEGNDQVEPIFVTVHVIPRTTNIVLKKDTEDISDKTIVLNVNDPNGITIDAVIKPNDASQVLDWEIDGPNSIYKATRSDKSIKIEPVITQKTGTITVTATAKDGTGISRKTTIVFAKMADRVVITNAPGMMMGGANIQLRTNLDEDKTLTERQVKWSIVDETGKEGNTRYASVTADGLLDTKTVAERTKIYVQATMLANPGNPPDVKEIWLCPAVNRIQIMRQTGEIDKGGNPILANVKNVVDYSEKTIKLDKVEYPAGHIASFVWDSSNKAVADFVPGTSELQLNGAGKTQITCTATDGSNTRGVYNLEVVKTAGYVEIDEVDPLVSGKNTVLTATVYTDETCTELAANQKVTWSVEDEYGNPTKAATINSRGRLYAKTVKYGTEVVVVAKSVENKDAEPGRISVTIKPKQAKTFMAVMTAEPEEVILGSSLDLNVGVETSIFGQWYISEDNEFDRECDCTYNSSNPDVASIDPEGTLITKKSGSTIITVRATDEDTHNVYTTKFTLRVANLVGYVHIDEADKGLNMRSGQSMNLTATAWTDSGMATKSDNQGFIWKVYQEDEETGEYIIAKAASVSSSGQVYANSVTKNTMVWVEAISRENSVRISSPCPIMIRPKDVYTPKVFFESEERDENGYPKELSGTVSRSITSDPMDIQVRAYASDPSFDPEKFDGQYCDPTVFGITWDSSNKKVIDVVGKDLVYKDTGKATVTAKFTVNGITYSASITINVVRPVTSLEVTSRTSSLDMYAGKSLLMLAKVNSDATNKRVEWSFFDEDDYEIASINSTTGLIRAKKGLTDRETVTVIAKTTDGYNTTSAPVTVTIYPLATKVEINEDSRITMVKDTEDTLTATVYPDGGLGANQKVTWSSSRSSIVSVDKNGNIVAKKRGTATIKAKAVDGSGKYATIKITVVNP